MLFNSLKFMVFLPAVLVLYWALPHRFRKYLLLAASYYFYMCWKPEFIVLILFFHSGQLFLRPVHPALSRGQKAYAHCRPDR